MIQRVLLPTFILPLLLSCEPPEQQSGSFVLIPSPQKFDVTGVSELTSADVVDFQVEGAELPVISELTELAEGGADAKVVLKVSEQLDLPQEGYNLSITDNQISIEAKDDAGALYGIITLSQILEDADNQQVNLPMCTISDYPELKYRAIHLDVKHHMEKKEYYYQLMDRLAGFKINAIIVELEDKIKYASHPTIGSADGWTVEEWTELSEYAKERNIEISPLVQGLGHASFILKHEEYKHLRDDPESDWAFNPLDPETYNIQFDLYKEAIEATPYGSYLHIGGDEVHTTGKDSGKSPLELQLIWLDKVCKYAEEQGRIPIFWDDMPLKFAEVYRPMFDKNISESSVDSIWNVNEPKLLKFIDQFPKNCVYMRWNYRTPETYGNQKAMEWFTSKGFQVMGATAGQTRWVLMPQNQSNIPSIRSFALSSIDKGLDGLLLTLWDDDSPHFELYMRGIISFAEYSWSGNERSVEEVKNAFLHRYFGPEVTTKMDFIGTLEASVGPWKDLLLVDGMSRNSLAKNDMNGVIGLPDSRSPGDWSKDFEERLAVAKEIKDRSDSVRNMIALIRSNNVRNDYTLDVYEQVNELVNYSAELLITLGEYDESPDHDADALPLLISDFENLRSEFEEVYSQTRVLTKPDGYILDQDHHRHSANQTLSFDWQFVAELAMLEQISQMVEN